MRTRQNDYTKTTNFHANTARYIIFETTRKYKNRFKQIFHSLITFYTTSRLVLLRYIFTVSEKNVFALFGLCRKNCSSRFSLFNDEKTGRTNQIQYIRKIEGGKYSNRFLAKRRTAGTGFVQWGKKHNTFTKAIWNVFWDSAFAVFVWGTHFSCVISRQSKPHNGFGFLKRQCLVTANLTDAPSRFVSG